MRGLTETLSERLSAIPTPVLADAVVRLQLPVRHAPAGIAARPPAVVAGRALPVRHSGSVDVFLEVVADARPGDVMVIDNGGRRDEACIGDLIAHEAMRAGVVAIVIWGLHRDAVEIEQLGLPVFSYGTLSFGPTQPRPTLDDRLSFAEFGEVIVTPADIVVSDPNGVLFLPADQIDSIASVAMSIRDAETQQIQLLRDGTTLRQQFDFDTYLQRRSHEPAYTFREHLREMQRAVEE